MCSGMHSDIFSGFGTCSDMCSGTSLSLRARHAAAAADTHPEHTIPKSDPRSRRRGRLRRSEEGKKEGGKGRERTGRDGTGKFERTKPRVVTGGETELKT